MEIVPSWAEVSSTKSLPSPSARHWTRTSAWLDSAVTVSSEYPGSWTSSRSPSVVIRTQGSGTEKGSGPRLRRSLFEGCDFDVRSRRRRDLLFLRRRRRRRLSSRSGGTVSWISGGGVSSIGYDQTLTCAGLRGGAHADASTASGTKDQRTQRLQPRRIIVNL